ncbi:MAG: hypothetical protein KME07_05590 [Pegethrix bostrychoides GSE-TBD4-15B]|jgi:hypothetical protein|uniref:Uncharacterized protein n=1 Tax=Pegethrix bostrychoides GSE-TBD4-15B TaxID=2839662 RepID=A0A951U4W8_9CYAN|nr:hypothetical protein [Pegethrix bostrychoides GSE-TBD4-15B]
MTTSQTSTPTLLVPVALEALVINTPMKGAVGFSRWLPNYDNLNKFQSPIPAPFNIEGGNPSNGVYLHWVLPDTFAHGNKQTASSQAGTAAAVRATAGMTEQQEVVFPNVPNRWLVVRIVPGTAATGTCRAWVVQSDYLGSQSSPGTNPFVDPFPTNTSAPNSVTTATLGKTVDLESWVEPAAAQLFLKAVGPATVTFSAYTPNVQDVFSVYDDLSDLPSDVYNGGTNLTYVVMGWYSDPTEDLLYGSQYGANGWATADQWMALMQELNWAVPAGAENLPAASLPKQSLCHGMIYAVQWQTTTVPKRVNLDPTQLHVAVGDNGIDAFTVLLESVAQNSGTTVNPELMEAFQYSLLPEMNPPDGAAQIALKAEQAWFASTPGGTLWQIAAAQRADLTQTNQPQPQITPAQAAALAQLNQAQVQLDQNRRQLGSLQSQLHDIWWKQQFAIQNGYQDSPPPAETQLAALWGQIFQAMQTALDTNTSGSLISQVIQLQSQIAGQVAALPDPHNPASIAHYATTVMELPPMLQLNPVAQPRFYQPSDPVLMIGGMEWPDRYIYGGASDPTAALLTRLGDQTITGLTVGSQTVTVSQLSQFIPMLSSAQQGKLPSQFVSLMMTLLQEAFFLDTDSAAVIVAQMGGSTPTEVATAIGSYVSGGTVNQTPAANVPATLGIAPWQQAWAPLFLEWKATYLPTPGTTSTAGVINWQFDGSDYDWPPPNIDSDTDPVTQTYSGRIFLSPHITFGFIARLKQYLQDNPSDPNAPGLQAIQKLIDQVGEWNFLSQTLSGFNDFLIMQDLDVTMPPDASVVAQVGDQYDSFPYPTPGFAGGGAWDPPPLPASYFFPIRAGHFYFQELQVVDRFGQVLPLLQANNNPTGNYESFYPIQGNELVPNSNYKPAGSVNPPSASSYLKQSPRLVQPARLEFNFLSATNDQQRSDLYANASPVCGWVLPNHLDQSLAIYDATGDLLGELLRVENSQGQYTLVWQPNPGDAAPIAPAQIANPHLQGFVQQLLSLNDQAAGFEALLQVIDATLWQVDPLSGRGDEKLSVLIGRPLALVRAELQLMLEGDPVQDQAWAWTCGSNWLNETSFDFTQVQFNLRLGSLDLFDDGLLGYFNSDNYGQFNSVHTPSSSTPYIAPIGENNYITLPPNYLRQPATQQTTKFVTLLLDPRGNIHATTGILPIQKVTLPEAYIGDAIKTLNVTFRVNGLLTDPDTIRIPIPALKHADWSWIERSDPNTWNTSLPIVKANQKPRLVNTPAVIHEGWLKLVDKQDS